MGFRGQSSPMSSTIIFGSAAREVVKSFTDPAKPKVALAAAALTSLRPNLLDIFYFAPQR